MPLPRAPAYAVFILWASACAFAPEVMWQGFLFLRSHFGAAEFYTAVFIGALFTFFVEPLAERLRAGKWRLPHSQEHGPGGSLLLGVPLSLSVGFALVCVHEAMGAFFGSAQSEEGARWMSLTGAIWQALEWTSVPAAVTAAWLVASASRRFAYAAAGVACAWTLATGFVWGWTWPDVVTTSAVGCLVALLGARVVLRGWDKDSLPALARIVAVTSVTCLASVLLVQAAAGWVSGRAFEFYTLSQAYEDLRFYLGWFLGLSFAPDPVPHGQAGHGQAGHGQSPVRVGTGGPVA